MLVGLNLEQYRLHARCSSGEVVCRVLPMKVFPTSLTRTKDRFLRASSQVPIPMFAFPKCLANTRGALLPFPSDSSSPFGIFEMAAPGLPCHSSGKVA
jgi:hypothetical protein